MSSNTSARGSGSTAQATAIFDAGIDTSRGDCVFNTVWEPQLGDVDPHATPLQALAPVVANYLADGGWSSGAAQSSDGLGRALYQGAPGIAMPLHGEEGEVPEPVSPVLLIGGLAVLARLAWQRCFAPPAFTAPRAGPGHSR